MLGYFWTMIRITANPQERSCCKQILLDWPNALYCSYKGHHFLANNLDMVLLQLCPRLTAARTGIILLLENSKRNEFKWSVLHPTPWWLQQYVMYLKMAESRLWMFHPQKKKKWTKKKKTIKTADMWGNNMLLGRSSHSTLCTYMRSTYCMHDGIL